DSERDDSGRAHPRDPRPDAAPSEPIHDGPGDCRLPRAVRAHDRVHVGGPRAARPRGIRAIARPFAIARNAVRFHGKTSIGIWEVLQNRAGDHSTIGETSPTRGNTSRGVSGPPVMGSGAPRNGKVIPPRPLFLLPTGQ